MSDASGKPSDWVVICKDPTFRDQSQGIHFHNKALGESMTIEPREDAIKAADELLRRGALLAADAGEVHRAKRVYGALSCFMQRWRDGKNRLRRSK